MQHQKEDLWNIWHVSITLLGALLHIICDHIR